MRSADVPTVWSPAAAQDVEDIWDYYALNVSPDAASRLVREIAAAAERAALHPLRGRPRDEIVPGLRSVRVKPYIVFYRVGSASTEIVRVLHERRDLRAALEK